jgi:NMD protein affecting ribosome stability and mRNA decay
MSLTGRSRCTACLSHVSTALFLELGHLCVQCYAVEDDFPLQSTPDAATIDAANECLSQEKRERLDANGWRVGSAEEFLERTEETSPSDIDPVAI